MARGEPRLGCWSSELSCALLGACDGNLGWMASTCSTLELCTLFDAETVCLGSLAVISEQASSFLMA